MRPTDPACPRCWAQAYKELGLKRGGLTSTAEVRKAYRARVLQDHPDKARPPPAADASTANDGARRTRQRSPPLATATSQASTAALAGAAAHGRQPPRAGEAAGGGAGALHAGAARL